MKRLVIVVLSIVVTSTAVGVLVGVVLFVALEKERKSVEKVSITTKKEPMVDSREELSTPQFGEFFGERVMETPQFPEAKTFFPFERDSGLEAPIRTKTKVLASEEVPELVTSILKKKDHSRSVQLGQRDLAHQ